LKVRDFNGDGRVDILWRNVSSGQLYVLLTRLISAASPGTDG